LSEVVQQSRACSSTKCSLFSLPCHFGGLGVVNPASICDSQFAASQKITGPLKYLIIKQSICAHLPDIRHIRARADV